MGTSLNTQENSNEDTFQDELQFMENESKKEKIYLSQKQSNIKKDKIKLS